MTVSRLSAIGLVAGLGLATTATAANAVEFRSTYSETRQCPVMEEGDDAFIRECTGPGNVRAVLQYVESLFGVFYLPMGGKEPMERADMLEVSTRASHPYGAKLEWRQRVGDAAPCAAIIRAYMPNGEFLVVNELATGNRVGLVKTNQQARNLADRACRSMGRQQAVAAAASGTETRAQPSARPVSLPPAAPAAAAEAAAPIATDDIGGLIASGQERFRKIYIETGVTGAIEALEECYGAFDRAPALARLVECGALDMAAARTDQQMMAGRPDLQQSYLANNSADERITTRLARLGLDDATRAAMAKALDVRTTAAAQAQSGSVFDFSE